MPDFLRLHVRMRDLAIVFMALWLSACGQGDSSNTVTSEPGLLSGPQLDRSTVAVNGEFNVDVEVNAATEVVQVALFDDSEPPQLQAVGVAEFEDTGTRVMSITVDVAANAKPGRYYPVISTCSDLLACDEAIVYQSNSKQARHYSRTQLRNAKPDNATSRRTDFLLSSIDIVAADNE